MTKVILEIPNISDWEALLPLLQRLKIRVSKIEIPTKTDADIQQAINIVKKGCDMSNFGDAMAWQMEVRKDRQLPYQD